MQQKKRLLIVDDDEHFLKNFGEFLREFSFEVITVSNPFHALEILESTKFHCIVLDIHMPGMSGIELLEKVMPRHLDTPIIMLTQRGGAVEAAVKSLKLGAFDFVEKGDDPDIIRNVVCHATEYAEYKHLLDELRDELSEKHQIITKSPVMTPVLDLIYRAAEIDSPVLLLGETGTGKTYFARAIHHRSNRALKRFTEIPIVSIPDTLIESELFGHVKGAFTGATENYPGKIKISDGGTIFLDEIGELSPNLQVKLNQFLDKKAFYPLGSNQMEHVDVRVIAATNRPLDELRSGKNFREDLFYRLSTMIITIPPLRERREDIWPLAKYFLEKHRDINPVVKAFHPLCRPLLEHYSWPGNVRELQNMVQRLIALTDTHDIQPDRVRNAISQATGSFKGFQQSFSAFEQVKDLKSAREEFEKEYIEYVLSLTNYNRTKTAEVLNLNRSHLQRKMKEYGLI